MGATRRRDTRTTMRGRRARLALVGLALTGVTLTTAPWGAISNQAGHVVAGGHWTGPDGGHWTGPDGGHWTGPDGGHWTGPDSYLIQ